MSIKKKIMKITITKLEQLNLKEVKEPSLVENIQELQAAFKKNTSKEGKAFFEEANAELIESYYQLVKEYYPKAIEEPKASQKKETKKIHTYSDGYRWQIISKEEAEKQFKADKEVFGLNLSEETESLIKEKKDLNDFVTFGIEKGFKDVAQPKKETPPKKAGNAKKEKPKRTSGFRGILRQVIDELTDLGIDLEGKDETIIATTRMDLEEALGLDTDLEVKLQTSIAAELFMDFSGDIKDEKIRKKAIASIKKLETIKSEEEKSEAKKKQVRKELEALAPQYDECRAVMKAYNQQRRENAPAKPKKNRYTKLKERLLSIVSLMPDELRKDETAIEKTESVLLKTHRDLIAVWGMNGLKAAPGQQAITEKFDQMQEKLEEDHKPNNPSPKTTDIKEDKEFGFVEFPRSKSAMIVKRDKITKNESRSQKAARWKKKVEAEFKENTKNLHTSDHQVLSLLKKDLEGSLKAIALYKKGDLEGVSEVLMQYETEVREAVPTDIFNEIISKK